MRKLSSNLQAILASSSLATFYLIKIVTPNTSVYDCSVDYPVTVPGVGTFTPSGTLINVEAPRLSEVVDREIYRIAFVDPTFEKIALFEAGLTGSFLSAYVGFYNTTDATLGGAEPGQPLLNLADLVVAYAGIIDTQGYTIDPANGQITAVIECSSPVANLGLARTLTTSKESLRQFSNSDTAFDQVYVGASQSSYLWGKA